MALAYIYHFDMYMNLATRYHEVCKCCNLKQVRSFCALSGGACFVVMLSCFLWMKFHFGWWISCAECRLWLGNLNCASLLVIYIIAMVQMGGSETYILQNWTDESRIESVNGSWWTCFGWGLLFCFLCLSHFLCRLWWSLSSNFLLIACSFVNS